MNQRQNMSGYTSEDIENAILSGIVKTLQIMKDVREEGDDLNSIDFDEVIEMRIRDMTDRSIYDAMQHMENSDEQ
jgi:hypothetical protein